MNIIMGNLLEFTLKTETEGIYDITRIVSDAISESGVEEGIAVIYCPHTTASVIITENTDSNVCDDILTGLRHAFPNRKEYTHMDGNSFAHIKSSVMQCELTLIIEGGWPILGAWQSIKFCEFDGPRERKYFIKIING